MAHKITAGWVEGLNYFACERPESPPKPGIRWDASCDKCLIMLQTHQAHHPNVRVELLETGSAKKRGITKLGDIVHRPESEDFVSENATMFRPVERITDEGTD